MTVGVPVGNGGGGDGGGGGGIVKVWGVGELEEFSFFFLIFLFVGCLTSQQHASVSQGWICTDILRAATLR